MKVLAILNEQKKAENTLDEDGVFKHIGAFTEKTLKCLDDSYQSIVLEDFTKVFIGYNQLKGLLKKYKLFFLNTIVLEAFVCNLYNFDRRELLNGLSISGIEFPCLFNPYKLTKGDGFDR